ncbi:MAG: DUF2254 domain-containing protein [Rubrivivax sp.]
MPSPKSLLLTTWERLRSSLWFVPTLMAAIAAALAFGGVALDESLADGWLRAQRWIYSGDAEGASQLMGIVAASMITIAGTVFSMTLVALSLASSQLGPRLLRNFMRDRANQVVLGTFIATFVYCMLVLRTIRRADDAPFVPHLSVSVGVLLALLSLGVLIYFIHHVSVSIQADNVVGRVYDELIAGIDKQFPEPLEPHGATPPAAMPLPAAFERGARCVSAARDGYLQVVDADALAALATQQDLVLRLEHRPGHYLVKGASQLLAWPAERITEEIAERIDAAFVLGDYRTDTQDITFGIDQIVEIAVRALSPGINDPFTAQTCVDRLASVLTRLARREMPKGERLDEQGRLRVVSNEVTFSACLDAAFDPIRQHALPSLAVTLRLLEAIAVIGAVAQRPQDRASLRSHAARVTRLALSGWTEPADRRRIKQARVRVREVLGRSPQRSRYARADG